jgi:hypothetical protein
VQRVERRRRRDLGDIAAARRVVVLGPGPGTGAQRAQEARGEAGLAVVVTPARGVEIQAGPARLGPGVSDTIVNQGHPSRISARVKRRVCADHDSVARKAVAASGTHDHWCPGRLVRAERRSDRSAVRVTSDQHLVAGKLLGSHGVPLGTADGRHRQTRRRCGLRLQTGGAAHDGVDVDQRGSRWWRRRADRGAHAQHETRGPHGKDKDKRTENTHGKAPRRSYARATNNCRPPQVAPLSHARASSHPVTVGAATPA